MPKKLQAKPGVKFRGHDLNLWHIVQKVEDGDNVLWVIKSWVAWEKGWLYEVVSDKGLRWLLENQDCLKQAGIVWHNTCIYKDNDAKTTTL